MSPTLETERFSQPPGRVLRRQWKHYKPHLPKSISLPALQLKPFNRPQFNCRRCGYTNFLIPLCLWCAWTSSEATLAWEASLPRCRTISAPTKVFFRANSDNLEHRMPRTSLESVASTLPPITPRGRSLDVPIAGVVTGTGSGDCYTHIADNVKASGRGDGPGCPPPSELSDPSASQDVLMTTSPTSPDDSEIPSTTLLTGTKSSSPTTLFFQRFHPERTPTMYHTEHGESEEAQLSPSPSAAPTATPRHHPRLLPSKSPTLQSPTPPQTLRRKKRMTILRQQSSCSLRSRFRASDDRPCTPPSIRLGTPSRPYYTAIRKNMSQPDSPPPTRSTSPSPCPSQLVPPPHILPRLMPLCSDPEEDLLTPRPLSQTLTPHPRHSGFSLSGEVELHLALSRKRSPEYRFRETRREKSKVKGTSASASVRGKVKKLGKGIKGIVFGRTWCQAG